MKHLIYLCIFFGLSQVSCEGDLNDNNSVKLIKDVVYDYEDILLNEEVEKLGKTLLGIKEGTSYSIVLVTTSNYFDYENIKEYSIAVGDELGVGNNGIILVLSKKMGEVRISVGDGIHSVLTDEVCAEIINSKIIPSFNEGLLFDGLLNGINSIQDKLTQKTI